MTKKFQRLSIVRLWSPDILPPNSPEDDRIQAEHMAYLGGLRDRGIIALNGPVRVKDSPKFRGLTVYTVDVEEARAYALEDPAVKAGWFEVLVDTTRIRTELDYMEVVSQEAIRLTVEWQFANPTEKFEPRDFDYAMGDSILSGLEYARQPQ